MSFYDTHAHLDDPAFRADLPRVIERAQAAGVTRIICVGTDLASSEEAVRLSEQYAMVYAVAGWHPNYALKAPEDWRPPLRRLAAHPKVVALGETGLDYYRLPSSKGGTAADDERFKQKQGRLLAQHLEVAAETGLSCVIHQRGAVLEETLDCWRPWVGRVQAVFHCFPGDTTALERIVELGGLVSFTGILTFKNGQNMREALAAAPAERFLLETDSPYLAPEPFRGRRCEPAHMLETARAAAEVRRCSLEELSVTTCANAHRFFRKLV
jgi:TatD DNase family protein